MKVNAMAKTSILRIIIVVFFGVFVMTLAFSCFRFFAEMKFLSPPGGRLDNDTLLLLLRSGIWQSDLTKRNSSSYQLNENQAKQTLRTMLPIEETMTNEGMLSDAEIDYKFSFQAGRNPLVFEIKIDGDKLIFQEYFSVHRGERYLYKGGNAHDFIEVVLQLCDCSSDVLLPQNTESGSPIDEN